MAGMRIEEVMTAPHSPWQSPYMERPIDSIRRETPESRVSVQRNTYATYFEKLYWVLRPISRSPTKLRRRFTGSRLEKQIGSDPPYFRWIL